MHQTHAIDGSRSINSLTDLRRSQFYMAAIGVGALALGMMVYVFDRPADAVYFVPDTWTVAATTPVLFGKLGQFLPAFLHALAFALFCSAIAGRRYLGVICAGWLTAETCFEIAQSDTVAALIAARVPGWFAQAPILENVSSHFLTGRFDGIDVVFVACGCATAFMIARYALPHSHSGSRGVRLMALLAVVAVGFVSILGSGGTGGA